MKTTYSVLGLQVDGMLEGIAEERDARVEEIVTAARGQAAELLASARTASRRRLREALGEDRARMERQIQQESAGLATAARVHRLRVQRDRLQRAHELAADALRARWQDPGHRRAWLETAVEACAVLEPGEWQVICAEGADADDLAHLRARLEPMAGRPPEVTTNDEPDAGLVITAPYLRLDLSAAGLLRDWEQVEGLLLATLLELEAAEAGDE